MEKIKQKIMLIKTKQEYDTMKHSFETSNADVNIKSQALQLMEDLHPIYSGTINHKLNDVLNDIYDSRADDIKLD